MRGMGDPHREALRGGEWLRKRHRWRTCRPVPIERVARVLKAPAKRAKALMEILPPQAKEMLAG